MTSLSLVSTRTEERIKVVRSLRDCRTDVGLLLNLLILVEDRLLRVDDPPGRHSFVPIDVALAKQGVGWTVQVHGPRGLSTIFNGMNAACMYHMTARVFNPGINGRWQFFVHNPTKDGCILDILLLP